MACGVPLVVSDSGEIPRVTGSAAIVVPESDTERWVEALSRQVSNPELRAQHARLGLERVSEKFDWVKVAAQFHEFFKCAAAS